MDAKLGHGLPCARRVPQMGAKDLPAVTFLLDLNAFPDKVQAGDLACDGYEPWTSGWGTSGNFFRQFGASFSRVGTKNKTPHASWDFLVKECRCAKTVGESTDSLLTS